MEVIYKKSVFNYETKKESGHLIYNTMYNSLVRLNEEEYMQYKNLDFQDVCFQEKLYGLGILMEPWIDERKIYGLYTGALARYQESAVHLTIAPTMECNARCFYCYENGVRHGKIDIKDADKIIKGLSAINLKKGLKITWFGGEPLMAQEWIDYFSRGLQEAGIDHSAFMISNGSKLDESVIEKMITDWKISDVQITMDGEEEEYFKRKNYIDQDKTLYFSLLRNIKKMGRKGINVQIRINVDPDNLESVYVLIDDLEQIFYKDKNITFYPSFLTGGQRRLSEEDRLKMILEIVKKVKDPNKIPITGYLYKPPKIHACFYNNKKAVSIDAKGDIFICEHMLGHREAAIGNIAQGFDEEKNHRKISGKRKECQKCVFLPKCHGGCYAAYMDGEGACFIEKYIIKAYLELL